MLSELGHCRAKWLYVRLSELGQCRAQRLYFVLTVMNIQVQQSLKYMNSFGENKNMRFPCIGSC
jgi:hypothetical protein